MSRRLKIGGFALLAVLLILQFFQPEQNNTPVDPELDMLAVLAPPEHIWALIRNACYDCHSNQTISPWYEKVFPVSWYLHKHIQDGKEDLNFSDYGKMDKADRIGVLVDFCDVPVYIMTPATTGRHTAMTISPKPTRHFWVTNKLTTKNMMKPMNAFE